MLQKFIGGPVEKQLKIGTVVPQGMRFADRGLDVPRSLRRLLHTQERAAKIKILPTVTCSR